MWPQISLGSTSDTMACCSKQWQQCYANVEPRQAVSSTITPLNGITWEAFDSSKKKRKEENDVVTTKEKLTTQNESGEK